VLDAPDAPHDGSVEPVEPALTVAAVARRLGVAPATLRTWDRRYGLGPSVHTAGSHRRYTGEDVSRLLVMRGLTLDGVAPSEAARVARTTELAEDSSTREDSVPRHLVPIAGTDWRGAHTLPAAGRTAPASRAGAVRPVVPGGQVGPTAVVDAAVRGDDATVRALLDSVPVGGLAAWWTDLVEPARTGIASRTLLARAGVEPDEIVVAAVLAVLRARAGRVPGHPSRRRVVLLLSPPGEARPLALHVLAGALGDAHVDARVVAGPVGRRRLLEIVTMTSPSAVVLQSEQESPDLDMADALATERPDLPLYLMLGDTAAATAPLGRAVQRFRSFTGLLHELLAVSGTVRS
jgi:transposase-like protein